MVIMVEFSSKIKYSEDELDVKNVINRALKIFQLNVPYDPIEEVTKTKKNSKNSDFPLYKSNLNKQQDFESLIVSYNFKNTHHQVENRNYASSINASWDNYPSKIYEYQIKKLEKKCEILQSIREGTKKALCKSLSHGFSDILRTEQEMNMNNFSKYSSLDPKKKVVSVDLSNLKNDNIDDSNIDRSNKHNHTRISFSERLNKLVNNLENIRIEGNIWDQKYSSSYEKNEIFDSSQMIISFTQHDDKLYELAMKSDDDEVLFERFNSKVYGSQIHCFAPDCWLNDEIINQYLNLLRQRSLIIVEKDINSWPKLKCYFHLTLFYTKLLENGKYDYKRVRCWTTRGFRKCDLFSMDIVFFPININNMHWSLVVTYMKQKRVEYFDSIFKSGDNIMKNIIRYLKDEYMDKKKETLDISEWKMINHDHIPKQVNTSDCGAFMSVYCNYLSLGQSLTFSKKDMSYFRKRMLIDIICGYSMPFPSIPEKY